MTTSRNIVAHFHKISTRDLPVLYLNKLEPCKDTNIIRCEECPDNFTRISSVNGCYKVATRNFEWSVAGLECRRLHRDAHLLVINNAAEQTAVARMLETTSRQYYFMFFLHYLVIIHIVSQHKHDPFPGRDNFVWCYLILLDFTETDLRGNLQQNTCLRPPHLAYCKTRKRGNCECIATRGSPTPRSPSPRFNFVARAKLELAQPIRCRLIAFLLLIRYVMLWPWPWPWRRSRSQHKRNVPAVKTL